MILAMIVWLRHLLGWLVSVFRSRQDLILENLPPAAIACPPRPPTSSSIHDSSAAVLGSVVASLGRMETTAHPSHTADRRRLASCWVSAVLEVTFPSALDGRPQAGQPGGSGLDRSDAG